MNEELPNNNKEMDSAFRIGYLVAGYIKNTLSDTERDELDDWVTASDDNMRLFVELTEEKNIEKGLREMGLYDADKALEKLKAKIDIRAKRKRAKSVRLYGIGIAACVILLIGLFLVTPLFEKKKEVNAITVSDLLPGSNKALLTIAGGKQIALDSARGTISQDGNMSIVNDKGVLSYQGQSEATSYHQLTTPKGGQYQLVLADGSKVWLNAASSIRFPTAFENNVRKVQVTGEAYFEVAHDKSKPFEVEVNGSYIQVLGTHFNVNAYPDEEGMKTTLLEGSVRVISAENKKTVVIKPGQQALVKDGSLSVTDNIDLDEVAGWKNGVFEFKDQPIEDIMRQVARWYDVTIKYEGKPAYHFNASIERSVPVSKLFHLLEMTDKVHFTIKDKSVIVTP